MSASDRQTEPWAWSGIPSNNRSWILPYDEKESSAGVMNGRFPVCRQEVHDVAGFCRGQPCKHINQVILRIDAAPATTHENRVDDGTAPAGIRMTYEEPSLSADRSRSDRVFDEVVVNLIASVAEIPGQSIVLVKEVADGTADRTFRQEPRL